MPTTQPVPDHHHAPRTRLAKPPRRQPLGLVDYPESDGKPMSETPIHWHATVDFAHPLMDRYAARPDAYVGSDMLMYWQEGNPGKRVSPDVFVAFGPDKMPPRRIWKVWEEGVAANFVLEVTSRTTRRRDEAYKAELYRSLGVTEYWQFDPTEDYLSPSLKGRRLRPDGTYEPVALEERDSGLAGCSEVLGLELRPDGHALRLFDPALGEFLPNSKEKSRIIEAVKAERDAEAAARRTAEARIAELERQLAKASE